MPVRNYGIITIQLATGSISQRIKLVKLQVPCSGTFMTQTRTGMEHQSFPRTGGQKVCDDNPLKVTFIDKISR